MFLQNGFRNALLDSPIEILRALDCDLVGISVARFSLPIEQAFAKSLFDRAIADGDVSDATPVYICSGESQVHVPGEPLRPIRVIGIDPAGHWFVDQRIDLQLEKLTTTFTALLDSRSRSKYGFELPKLDAIQKQSIELADQPIEIVGLVEIGTDFANDGSMIVSERTFGKLFPSRTLDSRLSQVDLALFRVRDGANHPQVAGRLTKMNDRLWVVMPRDQLMAREVQFWNQQTPVGAIFFIGSIVGFAVGLIICYQILFNIINDSLPEFATLKAIGYENRYFVTLVIKQATYLSILGFVPAVITSWFLFDGIEWIIGLPMHLTLSRVSFVFALTVGMCLISGVIALRKLFTADPASLF